MGLKKVTFVEAGKKTAKKGFLVRDGKVKGTVIVRIPNDNKPGGFNEVTLDSKKNKVKTVG
jgi:hypothetical protein